MRELGPGASDSALPFAVVVRWALVAELQLRVDFLRKHILFVGVNVVKGNLELLQLFDFGDEFL